MAIAYLGYEVDSDPVEKADTRLDKMSKSAGVADKKTALLKKGFVALGAAMAGAFAGGRIIQELSEFGSSMSQVAAITRATDAELKQLRATAKELGSTTEFSAAQAADGLKFLGMAGFTASEGIEAIPAVLDLATASSMGLASAADIASNVLSGFGKQAADAANVSDVLAAASTRSNTTVTQLGQAMSTAAPVARSLGVSMEDTAAAIGVMSDAGIQGSRAGTGLRGTLAALSKISSEAGESLANYGLTAADVNIETHGLNNVLQTLNEVGLSTADAMTIFGREAASGALTMIEASDRVKGFGQELTQVDGAAKDMAATMRDNLGGGIKSLMSAVSGLVLALGDAGLTAAIRAVIQGITDLTRFMTENLIPAIKAAGVAIAGLATLMAANMVTSMVAVAAGAVKVQMALGGVSVASGVYSVAIMAAQAATIRFAAATSAARIALIRFGGPLGIIYGVLGAIAGAIVLFGDKSKTASEGVQAAADAQEALNKSLGVFHKTGAPNAAAEAINLANENYTLAASAREAAAAEIAKAKAMLSSMENSIDTARVMGRRSAAEEKLANARLNLAAAEDALAEAEIRRNQVAREVTGGGMNLPSVTVNADPDVVNELAKSTGNLAEEMDTVTESTETLAEAMNNRLLQGIDSVASAFGDFIVNGFKDFKSFAKSILSTFKRMLSDMIAMAVRNKIMISLGFSGSAIGGAANAAGSVLGGGGAGGGILGGGGIGSLLGTGGAGLAGMAGAGGIMGGIGSVASGLGGILSGGGLGASFANLGGLLSGSVGGLGAIGAALPALGVVGFALSGFITKTKELDRGIQVNIDGMDTMVQTFRKLKKSKFWGLSTSIKNQLRDASDAVADPITKAVGDIQGGVMEAARVMGFGSSIFDDFMTEIKVSTKKLSDEEALAEIQKQLSAMGDEFASLVPNFDNMNDLLAAANKAVAETAALGSTRFESQILAAARRRGEITTTRGGPGFTEGQSLIRLQRLEEIDTKVEENTRQNNRINNKMLGLFERWEEVGIPRGPVIE